MTTSREPSHVTPPPTRSPWARILGSERVGRRAVALVLGLAAVVAVGVMVGQLTGRDDRAGGPPVTPSPSTTTPTAAPPTGGHGVDAGPETTGVPDGVVLEPHEGGVVDEADLVLDGVLVEGDLELAGEGQTLRNSRVLGQVVVRGGGITVEDSEVGALSIASATQVVARRVEVFGVLGSDGIHVTSDSGVRATNILVEGCWVHSPQIEPQSHYDGIQVRGVDGLTLLGNTLDLGPWQEPLNAAVFLEDANGGNTDVLVERNIINGGGYAVYVQGDGVRFVDNRFGRDYRWGLLYPEHPPFEESGSTWADDATPLTLAPKAG